MTQTIQKLAAFAAVLLGTTAGGGAAERNIVVLGDSIAAGYGVDQDESFPALLQSLIAEKDRSARVVNAGVSGDTTSGGSRRISWVLKQPVDVLIIELGGNDALRGIPPEITRKNLETIIGKAREKNPDMKILLAGMQIHQNMGKDYADKFKALFENVAKEQQVALVPFLLEGVGGVPELNQADEIHPNVEGHKRVAQNVWKVLEPMLVTEEGKSPDS